MRLTFLLTFLLTSYFAYAQPIDFESPIPSILQLDTTSNNIWQIGPPQKTFLNSARSPKNVLVTDTINNYPANVTSSFIYEFVFPVSANLNFWYKLDSEPGRDGGYIEMSLDEGVTWQRFVGNTILTGSSSYGYPVEAFFDNIYSQTDTLYDGTPGISGNVGWTSANIGFFCTAVKQGNVSALLRFTFISDGTDEREGWMFDDFSASYSPCGNNENLMANRLTVVPNPVSDRLLLDFGELYLEGQFTLTNSLGQPVLKQSAIAGYNLEAGVNHLVPGIYYYVLRTDELVTYTGKVLVVK